MLSLHVNPGSPSISRCYSVCAFEHNAVNRNLIFGNMNEYAFSSNINEERIWYDTVCILWIKTCFRSFQDSATEGVYRSSRVLEHGHHLQLHPGGLLRRNEPGLEGLHSLQRRRLRKHWKVEYWFQVNEKALYSCICNTLFYNIDCR